MRESETYMHTHNRMTLIIMSLDEFLELSEKWNVFPQHLTLTEDSPEKGQRYSQALSSG